jgi:chemotaxis protein methyltransferase CheR
LPTRKDNISSAEISACIRYIYNVSGINLCPDKAYLIESRLRDLLPEYHCATYGELVRLAETGQDAVLEKKIIDRMATHETLFFRDSDPFQLLQYKIIPDLIDRRIMPDGTAPIPINIWSTACSTGQEVYSIAIMLKDILSDITRYRIRLLGTDISDDALARASYGTYNKFEIERGLTKENIEKYFFRQDNQWKIRDDIRSMVQFCRQNLLRPLNIPGSFDVIFCRNVAVYFNKPDQEVLFNKLADRLAPDGYLILGASESMLGLATRFQAKEHLRTVYYQLKQ